MFKGGKERKKKTKGDSYEDPSITNTHTHMDKEGGERERERRERAIFPTEKTHEMPNIEGKKRKSTLHTATIWGPSKRERGRKLFSN